jgi:soluble lytic murein transglycosylase
VFKSEANAASKARAAYWRGRAAEAMRADPTPFYRRAADSSITYYGQLAAVRLGQRNVRLRAAPEARQSDTPVIRAIRFLEAADARDLALPLYTDVARQAPDAETLASLTRIARAHGDARAELTVARIALQRGFSFEREAFPVLLAADRAFSGNPEEWAIAHAVAKQESSFDPKAVSSAGARGLMQVLPGTAKETARKIGRSYDLAALTNDPGYNLLIGTAYFAELSKQYDGGMVLAIAAYNAGPGNVRKWIDTLGDPRQPGTDPIDWVERIPFSETRSYVQRVLENWQVYRQRQGRHATLRSENELKRQDRP